MTVDSSVHGPVSNYFYIVITARLEIGFEATRDVFDPQVSIRPREEIGYLPAEGLGTVNRLTAKGNISKKILSAFMNRDRDVDTAASSYKFVRWRIDYSVKKTFGNVEPLDQVCAFLQI